MHKAKIVLRYFALIVVLTVGTAYSIILYFEVKSWEMHRLQDAFYRTAERHVRSFQAALDDAVSAVYNLRESFAGRLVNAESFEKSVEAMLRRHRFIRGASWLVRVPSDARGVDETRQKSRARLPSFPVLYTKSTHEGEEISGWDHTSDPELLRTMQESRRRGRPAFTGRLRHLPDYISGNGLHLYLPVYERQVADNGKGFRSLDDVKAFIVIATSLPDLVRESFRGLPRAGTDFYFYDETKDGDQRLLYRFRSSELATRNAAKIRRPRGALNEFQWNSIVSASGRRWHLSCRSTPEYFSAGREWEALATLAIGLLVTFLLSGYLFLTLYYTGYVEKQVEWRTGQVAVMNEELKTELVQRRAAEEDLRVAMTHWRITFDSTSDAIMLLDRTFCVQKANAAAARFFRLSDAECAGKGIYDLLARRSWTERVSFVDPLIAGKERIEFEVSDPGRKQWVQITADPVLDSAGAVAGAVVFIRDISVRKKLEEVKDNFLSVVSHELKTPLAIVREAVVGLGDGLTGPLSQDQQRVVDLAKRNCERLSRLVNDILDLSRLESGKAVFMLSSINFKDVAGEIVENFRDTARQKGIRLELLLPDQLPAVRANSDMIARVLNNLVDNAVRFARKSVRVRARPVPRIAGLEVAALGFLQVTVSDDGCGIDAQSMPLLFSKFYQIDRPAGGGGYKGTGLGLAISREVVDLHGGKIWAESTFGEGADFHFALPVAQVKS